MSLDPAPLLPFLSRSDTWLLSAECDYSWAGAGPRLDANSRSLSTWVAVGDVDEVNSQLPSPHVEMIKVEGGINNLKLLRRINFTANNCEECRTLSSKELNSVSHNRGLQLLIHRCASLPHASNHTVFRSISKDEHCRVFQVVISTINGQQRT